MMKAQYLNMNKTSGYQIHQLLITAKENLVYCQSVQLVPKSVGKLFDPSKNVDQFYMTVCTLCFHDALLIVASLLEKNDARPVSFKNWPEFNQNERVDEIYERFLKSPLKPIRDKVVAHQDSGNSSISVLTGRRRGVVGDEYVKLLSDFLKELILVFCDFQKTIGQKFHPQISFDASAAKEEIESVLNLATPHLYSPPKV